MNSPWPTHSPALPDRDLSELLFTVANISVSPVPFACIRCTRTSDPNDAAILYRPNTTRNIFVAMHTPIRMPYLMTRIRTDLIRSAQTRPCSSISHLRLGLSSNARRSNNNDLISTAHLEERLAESLASQPGTSRRRRGRARIDVDRTRDSKSRQHGRYGDRTRGGKEGEEAEFRGTFTIYPRSVLRYPVAFQRPDLSVHTLPLGRVTAIRCKYRFDGFRTFDLGMPCADPDPSTRDGGRLSTTCFTGTGRFGTAV